MKTNAARALDRLGIRYELRVYAVDPGDRELDAKTLARLTGDRKIEARAGPGVRRTPG